MEKYFSRDDLSYAFPDLIHLSIQFSGLYKKKVHKNIIRVKTCSTMNMKSESEVH